MNRTIERDPGVGKATDVALAINGMITMQTRRRKKQFEPCPVCHGHYPKCDACDGTGKIDTSLAIPANEARYVEE